MNSIVFKGIDELGKCYLCGKTGQHVHHLIPGTANRANSEREGLKVLLCLDCHNLVHLIGNLMKILRVIGELAYIQSYFREVAIGIVNEELSGDCTEEQYFENAVQCFRDIFGKSFI